MFLVPISFVSLRTAAAIMTDSRAGARFGCLLEATYRRGKKRILAFVCAQHAYPAVARVYTKTKTPQINHVLFSAGTGLASHSGVSALTFPTLFIAFLCIDAGMA
jgi:hypothetical protein